MIPKFRIFIKDTQFMDYDVVGIDFKREHAIVDTGWDIEEIRRFKDVVLMQSTGLTDKNGKEIFEGDILNHPLQGMRKVYYPFTDRVASYGLENIENGMRNTLQDAHRIYEVIGNVHEHPHLLKKENN